MRVARVLESTNILPSFALAPVPTDSNVADARLGQLLKRYLRLAPAPVRQFFMVMDAPAVKLDENIPGTYVFVLLKLLVILTVFRPLQPPNIQYALLTRALKTFEMFNV